ncbi:MAG: hypothetical protein PHC86_08145 [Eubacteriales bacterium]|nr:hypothetical protein [Eubacteriales bacterium]
MLSQICDLTWSGKNLTRVGAGQHVDSNRVSGMNNDDIDTTLDEVFNLLDLFGNIAFTCDIAEFSASSFDLLVNVLANNCPNRVAEILDGHADFKVLAAAVVAAGAAEAAAGSAQPASKMVNADVLY